MPSATTTLESQRYESEQANLTPPSQRPTHLAHPIPDLQTIKGAYMQNIERLEERAERMSFESDLCAEIRRLHQPQKLSDSRRASLHAVDTPYSLSKNVSTSSLANSTVELDSAARQGGYLPYSPIQSIRLGSGSHLSVPSSTAPGRTSRNFRLKKIDACELQEQPRSKMDGGTLPDDLPIRSSLQPISGGSSYTDKADQDTRAQRMKRLSTGRLPSDGSFTNLYNELVNANHSIAELSSARVVSDTSFTDIYNQIAGEIREQLRPYPAESQERAREQIQANVGAGQRGGDRFSMLRPQGSSPRISQSYSPSRRGQEQPNVGDIADGDFSFASSTQHPYLLQHRNTSGPMRLHVPDDGDVLSDRPTTASSQDTYQQAQGLFHDFDGIHYTPSIRSNVSSLRSHREAIVPSTSLADLHQPSMIRTLDRGEMRSNLVPPPEDGMIFYPAPVPRVLNIPQRLSQMPSAAIMAKQKKDMFNALPDAVRKSAPWLSRQGEVGKSEDASGPKPSLAALPPQLRASMFFDSGSGMQHVEVRDQSPVKTLDDLLDASAQVPAGAFTGYSATKKSGRTLHKKTRPSQVSLDIGQHLLPKRESKSSVLDSMENSSPGRLKSAPSKCIKSPEGSLHAQIYSAIDDAAATREHLLIFDEELSTAFGADAFGEPRDSRNTLTDHEYHEDDSEYSEVEEGVVADLPCDYHPTTLLAELEVRKRQQKDRGRTAFDAFPNGMYATLLELDNVAQLQKANRTRKRVALAWEDPHLRDAGEAIEDDNDNVPLGVLYAGNSQLVDKRLAQNWSRPLGLLEKQYLEENEPLSLRRNRLLGIKPSTNVGNAWAMDEAQAENDSEHGRETLGDRLKRLRAKKVLDDAIGEVEGRPINSAFSENLPSKMESEVQKTSEGLQANEQPQSRFNILEKTSTRNLVQSPKSDQCSLDKSNIATSGDLNDEDAEETLGQRRARLQREALSYDKRVSLSRLSHEPYTTIDTAPAMVSSDNPTPTRTPPLRTSPSLADLLSAYPTGKNDARKVSNDMLVSSLPHGSLLAQEEGKTAARKARMRMSSAELLASTKPILVQTGTTQRPAVCDRYVDPALPYTILNPQAANGGNMEKSMHNASTLRARHKMVKTHDLREQPEHHGPGRSLWGQEAGSRVDAWRQSIMP